MEWNVWQRFCVFSVENQPKPLLWSWLSQSMNEWIGYERKSHKRGSWGQRVAVFLGPRELVVTLLMSILIPPHMVVTHTKKSLLSEYIQGSEEGL